MTPLDAQGNPGEQSEVRSFTWEWPSTTTPVVEDIVDDTELYDPKFSWDPVPGAARYEVEVNSSSDFSSGSKVCCTDKPIATTLTPREVFVNNTYYWRVRAINARNPADAGVWNVGPSFTKTFDNYPALDEDAIKNLRMRDTDDPGTDSDSGTPGYQTELPILTWDPVPGASSYQVNVVPFEFDAGSRELHLRLGRDHGQVAGLDRLDVVDPARLRIDCHSAPDAEHPAFQRTRPASSRARHTARESMLAAGV